VKSVVLTGAAGFIGRLCMPVLRERGYVVHTVSRRSERTTAPDVVSHQADLLDGAQVKTLMRAVQPSHLLHLAWYSEPGKYWTSSANWQWRDASIELTRAFVECGGRRLVVAGSCAEYDWRHSYCAEDRTPTGPTTPYGIAKHELQRAVSAHAAATGISQAWARIFLLYGPGEHPLRLVASAILACLRGEPTRCSHGEQVRDFLHVADVASALVALLDSDLKGPVNVASGAPTRIKDVVREVGQATGRPDLIRFGDIPAPDGEPRELLADVSRLRAELQWAPRYDLQTGIRDAVTWWRKALATAGEQGLPGPGGAAVGAETAET